MRLRYLSVFLLLLLSSTGAHSQGCTPRPNYSVYTSATGDGTTIFTSVTISGTTSDMSPYCGFNPRHTPYAASAYNGGTGSWVQGPSGCPTCYISATNQQSLQANSLELDFEAQVVCTIAGTFFQFPWNKQQFEFALTYIKDTVAAQAPNYAKISNCTPATSPPDWYGPASDTVSGAELVKALMERSVSWGTPFYGVHWVYLFQIPPNNPLPGDTPGDCTNADKGYPGA